jgi:hypothetical protein
MNAKDLQELKNLVESINETYRNAQINLKSTGLLKRKRGLMLLEAPYKEFQKHCFEQGTTVSAVIDELISEYLKKVQQTEFKRKFEP